MSFMNFCACYYYTNMPDDFQSFHFTFAEVAPTIFEVLDFLHSTDLEEEHPAVVFIREILDELNFDTEITGGYIVKEISDLNVKIGRILIAGNELNLGRQVCGYIKESTQVALFICTAGGDFTKMTNALNEQGDIMEAYLLDAIGSLTVENAIGKLSCILPMAFSTVNEPIASRR